MKKIISLWSGGKDSCFACYKAKQKGYNILSLLNLASFDGTSSISHGLSSQIIKRQTELIDIPFHQKPIAQTRYRQAFMELIEDFKREKGVEGIVFGDIYLQEHKDWIDKVCEELNVEAILPIWGKDTSELIDEIIQAGFKSIVVSVRKDILDKDWLGREINFGFVRDLKAKGNIDPCGEKGEFHTFVYDAPLFRKPVEFNMGKKFLRGNHWFLEIT